MVLNRISLNRKKWQQMIKKIEIWKRKIGKEFVIKRIDYKQTQNNDFFMWKATKSN